MEGVIIETYYLIDYENVGADGLAGCDRLTKSDHIYIFFTRNAKKIDMCEIAKHGDAELKMIEIPAGKQSTDIHISSYLGYLSGKHVSENNANDCSVVIISKDSDYDNVIKFWKEETQIKASKALQIKSSTPKATIAKQTSQSRKSITKVDGNKKTKLNQEIMKAVRGAGFDASVGNSVAQLVTGLYGEERFMNKVHNLLREKYTNYLEVYEAIKPVLSKYPDTLPSSAEANCVANTQIQQLLSKANFDRDIINYVASVVTKNVGEKNKKQQIYRTIVSKYGQSKGLKIYNQIKKSI